MNHLKAFLQNHRIAVFLAIITALIVALPQVYFRIDHRDDGVYAGIELLPDSPWSARAREVMDGHPWFGNIYNKDGKDLPYLFQPLGSMTVAYMGELFGLDINNTLLLSRLVLTFVVFMLMYGFVFLISGDKRAAISSTILFLLMEGAMSPNGLMNLLHGVSPESFLRMARPVNPAMVYVLLFSFLITFWLYYKGQGKRYGFLSALFLGLNFYNYFYTWTYLYAFGGFLVFLLFVQKKWNEGVRLLWVFLGAFLVGIPYVINLHNVTQHPAYEEVGQRFGLLLTHAPLFIGMLALIGLVVFLFKFPKDDRERYTFALALMLAPLATMNQQILTGKVLQTSHYHWFFHKPLAIIIVFIVLFHLLGKSIRFASYRLLVVLMVVTISLASGLFVQMDSYFHSNKDGGEIAIERQKYGPVMEWLNQNVEKESVVFGNDETSHLTVIYTPLNVFYHRASPFASLSSTRARQLEVLFSFYRLRGVDATNAREVFYTERETLSGQVYGIHYRELYGTYASIPDEKVEEILNEYLSTLSVPPAEWLENIFSKYEVSYFVWDKKTDPEWNTTDYTFLTPVASFDTIEIYRFSPSTRTIE
jgi:hypothetical protein